MRTSARTGFSCDDGRRCRGCGCTETQACMTDNGPCAWVAPDVDYCTGCMEMGDVR